MRRDDPSFRMVVAAARGLGDLVDEVVFLGCATTNLLLTDPAAPSVRPTLDVDVVVQVASTIEYLRLEGELERRGFLQDESRGAPRCRRIREGVRLDVMPTDAAILGFTNRWYPAVCATATRVELEPDLLIWLVTPPLFVATKCAFTSPLRLDSSSHCRGSGMPCRATCQVTRRVRLACASSSIASPRSAGSRSAQSSSRGFLRKRA